MGVMQQKDMWQAHLEQYFINNIIKVTPKSTWSFWGNFAGNFKNKKSAENACICEFFVIKY